MSNLLYVKVSYAALAERLEMLVERRLQPEIAFTGPDLDQLDPSLIDKVAASLADNDLSVSIHAPFFDLNPGALEPYVLEATAIRYRQTMAVADRLGAKTIVFHPGYEFWKYGGVDQLWIDASMQFWPPLLQLAEEFGQTLALENIFDTRPDPLRILLDQLDSPSLGHCFDIGHWRLFSDYSIEEWFSALGSRLVHLHLHDNRGTADDHLPVGEGDIDFADFFRQLDQVDASPSMTLEAHTLDEMDRSLVNIQPYINR